MEEQHAVARSALRPEQWTIGADECLVRHGEDRKIELGEFQPASLIGHDMHTNLLEQPEDAPRLRQPGRVVVAGDQDDRCIGKPFAQALELLERKDDGGVGGTNGVEEVAGHDDGVGPVGNDTVDGQPKGPCDIRLALVDACRVLTVVLSNAEVGVGDVREFHPRNVS